MALFRSACERGDLSEVRRLLDDPDVDHNSADEWDRTGFWLACIKKHLEVVAELLEHDKIKVNLTECATGRTIFHHACRYGSVELVALLKGNMRVCITSKASYGESPYFDAALAGRLDVLRSLDADPRRSFCHVNDVDSAGLTPLYAAVQGGHVEVVSYLISLPNNKINRICGAMTALHVACVDGRAKVVKALLQSPDIEVNTISLTCSMAPAFFLACQEGHPDTVRLMLRDPRVKVKKGDYMMRSPLIAAVIRQHVEVVRLLIHSPRVVPNIVSHEGTALFIAARYGLMQCVEILFTSEQVISTIIRHDGVTPSEQAKTKGRHDIAALIDEYQENRDLVRHRLRHKHGVFEQFAAELFALIVLHCDGYLQFVREPETQKARFFTMAARLPLELQMVLCNRTFEIMQINITSKHREEAFSEMVYRCMTV